MAPNSYIKYVPLVSPSYKFLGHHKCSFSLAWVSCVCDPLFSFFLVFELLWLVIVDNHTATSQSKQKRATSPYLIMEKYSPEGRGPAAFSCADETDDESPSPCSRLCCWPLLSDGGCSCQLALNGLSTVTSRTIFSPSARPKKRRASGSCSGAVAAGAEICNAYDLAVSKYNSSIHTCHMKHMNMHARGKEVQIGVRE